MGEPEPGEPDGGSGPDVEPPDEPVDEDADGYASLASGGPDCDDTDPTISPDADDVLGDGIDRDCDGLDGVDRDGDRHASIASGGSDCDDGDAMVHPGAPGFTSEVVRQAVGTAEVALTLAPDGWPWIAHASDGHVALATGGPGGWNLDVLSEETSCGGLDASVSADGEPLVSYQCDGHAVVLARPGRGGWSETRPAYDGNGNGTLLLGDDRDHPTIVFASDWDFGDEGCEYACGGTTDSAHAILAARPEDGEWVTRPLITMLGGDAPLRPWGLAQDADEVVHVAVGAPGQILLLSGTPSQRAEWASREAFAREALGAELALGPEGAVRIAATLDDGSLQLASLACGDVRARVLGEAVGKPRVERGPDGTLHVAWIAEGAGLTTLALRGAASAPLVVDVRATGAFDMVIGPDGLARFAYLTGDTLRYATGPGQPLDSDCDGVAAMDADGDGHTAQADGGLDCDDADPGVGPLEEDAPGDGRDTDCDGADGVDRDGDSVLSASDCDDADPGAR